MELTTISVILSFVAIFTSGYGIGKDSLKIKTFAIFIAISSFIITGCSIPNLPTINEIIIIIIFVVTALATGYFASGITYVEKGCVKIITY